MMGYGFGLIESLFPVFFVIVFLIVVGGFVAMAIRGISRYSKNEASPVLTVTAKVVGKRESVTRHTHGTGDHFHHSSSTYYVTFEVESGDRFELSMPGEEFGMLAEGDGGQLTFQGTRYRGFERVRG